MDMRDNWKCFCPRSQKNQLFSQSIFFWHHESQNTVETHTQKVGITVILLLIRKWQSFFLDERLLLERRLQSHGDWFLDRGQIETKCLVITSRFVGELKQSACLLACFLGRRVHSHGVCFSVCGTNRNKVLACLLILFGSGMIQTTCMHAHRCLLAPPTRFRNDSIDRILACD